MHCYWKMFSDEDVKLRIRISAILLSDENYSVEYVFVQNIFVSNYRYLYIFISKNVKYHFIKFIVEKMLIYSRVPFFLNLCFNHLLSLA